VHVRTVNLKANSFHLWVIKDDDIIKKIEATDNKIVHKYNKIKNKLEFKWVLILFHKTNL